MNKIFTSILITFQFTLISITQAQPAFTCDDALYQIHGFSGRLGEMDLNSGNFINIGSASSDGYNAFGYNVVDNYGYGLIRASNRLARVHADGTFSNLGPVLGLPNQAHNAGDFGGDGLLYVKKNGGGNELRAINVYARVMVKVLTLSESISITDFVYVSSTNRFYSLKTAGGGTYQFVSIHPTTGQVTYIGPARSYSSQLGAMFTDIYGNVYAATNDGSGLYSLDKNTGARTRVTTNVPAANINDGFSCPMADPILLDESAMGFNFQVSKTNNAIKLHWNYTNEAILENSFIIEKSTDALHFQSCLDANHSISNLGTGSYEATDHTPTEGFSYYRVRYQEDNIFRYSAIQAVMHEKAFADAQNLAIYPNPANERLNIILPEYWKDQDISIEIINTLGQQLYVQPQHANGENILSVDIKDLPNGHYMLRAQASNDILKVLPFIKQ